MCVCVFPTLQPHIFFWLNCVCCFVIAIVNLKARAHTHSNLQKCKEKTQNFTENLKKKKLKKATQMYEK